MVPVTHYLVLSAILFAIGTAVAIHQQIGPAISIYISPNRRTITFAYQCCLVGKRKTTISIIQKKSRKTLIAQIFRSHNK